MTAEDWAKILWITGTVGLFAVVVGLTPVLLALALREQGVGAGLIGTTAAMRPLGMVVAALLVPHLAARFGAMRLARAAALLGAATLVLMGAWHDIRLWLPANFVVGAVIGAVYIIIKTWVNERVSDRQRGRVIGLFTTVLSAGFVMGPFSVALLGTGGAAFAVGVGVFLSTFALLAVAGRGLPAFPSGKGRGAMLAIVPLAPVPLLAAAMFGLFDDATLALLPVYGAQHGLDARTMAAAVGVLNLGSVVLQFPIGWLADRWPRRAVLILCALVTGVGALALPLAIAHPAWFWPLLFVWGAAAYGVVTVAIAILGDAFRSADLLAATAALTMAGGVGGILGAPLVGASMDAFGAEALPACLAAAFAALAVLAATGWMVKEASTRA